jgi:hypothetical protein
MVRIRLPPAASHVRTWFLDQPPEPEVVDLLLRRGRRGGRAGRNRICRRFPLSTRGLTGQQIMSSEG